MVLEDFAQRIKSLRIARGYSQERFALKIDMEELTTHPLKVEKRSKKEYSAKRYQENSRHI